MTIDSNSSIASGVSTSFSQSVSALNRISLSVSARQINVAVNSKHPYSKWHLFSIWFKKCVK